MTLILSVATSKLVAQAADRRLMLPDGRLFDDEANKSVIVYCANAMFGLSYSGLARIGAQPTDDYLTELFQNLRAPERPLSLLLDEARTALTDRFLKADIQRLDSSTRRLSVSAVGLGGPSFAFALSNFERWKEEPAGAARSSFDADFSVERSGRAPLCITAAGAVSALSDRALLKLHAIRKRGFFHKSTPDAIAARLVAAIREAATAKVARNTIGRHCMSLWAAKGGRGFETRYHDDLGRPTGYMPNIVHPMGTAKDIHFQLPPGMTIRVFGSPTNPPRKPKK